MGEENNKRTKQPKKRVKKNWNYAYVTGEALESQKGGRKEGEERQRR